MAVCMRSQTGLGIHVMESDMCRVPFTSTPGSIRRGGRFLGTPEENGTYQLTLHQFLIRCSRWGVCTSKIQHERDD